MTRKAARGLWAVLLTAAVMSTAAACSDDGGSASSTASKAASAAASAASRGADVVASATAAAGEKLKNFKNGVNAKGDVELGKPSTDGDGRVTVKVTVKNSSDSAKSYAVQVNFDDASGNLLDTVVVTVDGVGPKASKDAMARSNRKLSGDVKADVANALRH
ncbi:FxLYD domain-containing protein [Streptomyces sp. NBC_01591]|uniref:FxLYD domain-containing protein n=1 Tax=Streptomyces sp. NBC_01591 TaxID=2975888 RepID=UPI002DD92A28|nr:FxLYD domain-containing protein [Streptomyces sp. NBC_01591]WSD68052.1 FxLYD domain-containing protein [Streptomyces sp. NBC_01591]